MPEGDTIWKVAREIGRRLDGQTLSSLIVDGREVAGLRGVRIHSVESRGKHLLVGLGGEATLHVHLGMSGNWHRYGRDERWQRPRWQAKVVIESGDHLLVCFSPSVFEVLDARRVELHPALSALGPDLLATEVDYVEVLRRARTQRGREVALVLLDQKVSAGIGNVYKSEILFMSGVNPWTLAGEILDDQLHGIYQLASRFLKENARRPGMRITTTHGRREPLWVYNRASRPCFVCRSLIRCRAQGDDGRPTYWCPTCQR